MRFLSLLIPLLFAQLGAAEACTEHNQCVGITLCYSGSCVPAAPSHTYCTKQIDCMSNQVCRFGVCLRPAGRGRLNHTDDGQSRRNPSASSRSGCHNHQDCPGQQLCYRGKCTIAYPLEGSCDKDAHCRQRGACKYKTCWTALDKAMIKKLKLTEFIHLRNLIVKQKLYEKKLLPDSVSRSPANFQN